MRFSESTGAFYPYEIDYGSNLPSDVVDVPIEAYQAAMEARASGHKIAFVDGELVVSQSDPVPFADQAAPYMASVRITREAILNRLAGIGMAAIVSGDVASSEAIAAARTALLDITADPGVIEATDLQELKAAVLAAYKRIVDAVPDTVKKAFNGMDE